MQQSKLLRFYLREVRSSAPMKIVPVIAQCHHPRRPLQRTVSKGTQFLSEGWSQIRKAIDRISPVAQAIAPLVNINTFCMSLQRFMIEECYKFCGVVVETVRSLLKGQATDVFVLLRKERHSLESNGAWQHLLYEFGKAQGYMEKKLQKKSIQEIRIVEQNIRKCDAVLRDELDLEEYTYLTQAYQPGRMSHMVLQELINVSDLNFPRALHNTQFAIHSQLNCSENGVIQLHGRTSDEKRGKKFFIKRVKK